MTDDDLTDEELRGLREEITNAFSDLLVLEHTRWFVAKLLATDKGEWLNINDAFRKQGKQLQPGIPDTGLALWAPYGMEEQLNGQKYEAVAVVFFDADSFASTVAQYNKAYLMEWAEEQVDSA